MSSVPTIFDRQKIATHRRRASGHFDEYDFLYTEVAQRLVDRLRDFNRRFERILIIGALGGEVVRILEHEFGYARECIVSLDMSSLSGVDVIGDEEYLPFQSQSFDCVLSNLTLPFVNDFPGVLAQIQMCLKPDGVFLSSIFGTLTLHELRTSLMQAEIALLGGASNRIAPFIDIVDATALMQRAKFALPVVDQDLISVSYPDMKRLLKDIKGMGLSDPLHKSDRMMFSRDLFDQAGQIYKDSFPDPKAEDRIHASFEILYLTGWRPHESQQQPLRPGTADHRLADALKSTETVFADHK